jgi:hypothetical protein
VDVSEGSVEEGEDEEQRRRRRRRRSGRRADEQMHAGNAGISNISGAWAAIPSVGPMCVPNGIEKARGRTGARGAWRRRRRR